MTTINQEITVNVASPDFVPLRTPTQISLAGIWRQALGIDCVGLKDNFFDAGGDSLLAVCLFAEIKKRYGRDLPMSVLLEGGTVEHLAGVIDGPAASWSSLVELRPGVGPPFFLVHGVGGEVTSFQKLVDNFCGDQPLYGIRGLPRSEQSGVQSLEALAARYLDDVRLLQPRGPYFLSGYSMGAPVAFEMAQQLVADGQEVAELVLLDAASPGRAASLPVWRPRIAWQFARNCFYYAIDDLCQASVKELWQRACNKVRVGAVRLCEILLRQPPPAPGVRRARAVFNVSQLPSSFRDTIEHHYELMLNYRPKLYAGRLTVFRGRGRSPWPPRSDDLGWGELAAGGTEVILLPANHNSILKEPHVARLAQLLADRLRVARESSPRTGPQNPGRSPEKAFNQQESRGLMEVSGA